ncbi:hypothetical protein B4U79_14213 [Dinothrombium tinctorium]|uniref:Uncharacterized protein n=1 Tax=Dinothrombium tinctorium TaxID=1965070 RepID=A0A443R3Y1_9ACAR|nr:hypothetical protein B4U79_14213 [Dinothrombium tinctorium]
MKNRMYSPGYSTRAHLKNSFTSAALNLWFINF